MESDINMWGQLLGDTRNLHNSRYSDLGNVAALVFGNSYHRASITLREEAVNGRSELKKIRPLFSKYWPPLLLLKVLKPILRELVADESAATASEACSTRLLIGGH